VSAAYRPVQWTRRKIVYDVVAAIAIAAYVPLYQTIARVRFQGDQALSEPILAMRAWGSCAFLLLSCILAIGPLARLDRRFLPLLYNRRHLGVMMSLVGLMHAWQVLGFYYAYGGLAKLEALFTFDRSVTSVTVPYVLFGVGALVVIVAMAATSHDFWQKLFGGTTWKWLHMLVYVAYASAVTHVAFGALQSERRDSYAAIVLGAAAVVIALHLAAARRARGPDRPAPREVEVEGARWLDAGPVETLRDGRARPLCPSGGERIAIVRAGDQVAALHGVCAHQGGPLSEGRVLDGCLTCPWHGWQYRASDGHSPPPFEEKIPTYRLRIVNGRILVDPRPRPVDDPADPVTMTAPAPAPEEPT